MELESPPEYKRELEREDCVYLLELRDELDKAMERLQYMGRYADVMGDVASSDDIIDIRSGLSRAIDALDNILES